MKFLHTNSLLRFHFLFVMRLLARFEYLKNLFFPVLVWAMLDQGLITICNWVNWSNGHPLFLIPGWRIWHFSWLWLWHGPSSVLDSSNTRTAFLRVTVSSLLVTRTSWASVRTSTEGSFSGNDWWQLLCTLSRARTSCGLSNKARTSSAIVIVKNPHLCWWRARQRSSTIESSYTEGFC